MNDMHEMLAQYAQSCGQIVDRIHGLNAQINGQAPSSGRSLQELMRRRKLLYTELAEMQGSIREMQEYIDALAEREMRRKGRSA